MNKLPPLDCPADCTEWLVSNIKNLKLVRTYLKGVADAKISTARFIEVVDSDLALSSVSFMVDGAPFPRPASTNTVFGSFDARVLEPGMLSLEKLGKKG